MSKNVEEAAGAKMNSEAEGISPELRWAIIAIVVGGITAILDTTIVTIALHKLTGDLRVGVDTIQWVATGYLLALSVVIPISGFLQSRLGGRRAWIFGLCVFGLGSVLCATAWNSTSLIGFRVLEGFGAGVIIPLMQTLPIQVAGGRPSGRLMALVSMPIALGPILGPVLGGVVLTWLSWRWLFLINVPILLVAVWLAWRHLPTLESIGEREPLDVLGLALLAPTLAALLLGLSNVAEDGSFDHANVLIWLVIGAVLGVCFTIWALRRKGTAIVEIRLLRFRSLAASAGTMFTSGAAMYSALFALPLFFQDLRGESVLKAAFLLAPQGVGALLVRTFVGRVMDRAGARAVAVGAYLVAVLGTLPFALVGKGIPVLLLGLVLVVRGMGMGALIIPPMTVAYDDISRADIPHATMLTRIAQHVGGSFGVAIAAVVLQSNMRHGVVAAFHASFWAVIVISVVALVPAFALPGRERAGGTVGALRDSAAAAATEPSSPPNAAE